MNKQALLYHVVTLDSPRGIIRRTVIAEAGDILVLAQVESPAIVKMTGIGPFSIGFLRSDVLSDEGIDTSVCLKHNVQYEQAEHGEAGPDRGDVD